MKTMKTWAENRAQAEAFRRMKGNVIDLIDQYAGDFRQIITEFELAYNGRIPTADDLIWIESQHCGFDITRH